MRENNDLTDKSGVNRREEKGELPKLPNLAGERLNDDSVVGI